MLMVATTSVSSVAFSEPSKPVEAQLRQLNTKRIYFGHHSVGDNILDGLRDLSRQSGVPLRIAEVERANGDAGILHGRVGENTRPYSKIEAFERVMGSEEPTNAEIAFFKFCYVDFDAQTNVDALFARYLEMVEGLKRSHPQVTWVHVTVPLTVTQGGVKGYVKKLLGRAPWGELENVKRHRFNELLRARFGATHPFFDLARVEATRADGTLETFERDGQRFPRLVPAYSYDGEHLNEEGRQRAARALVELLASLP